MFFYTLGLLSFLAISGKSLNRVLMYFYTLRFLLSLTLGSDFYEHLRRISVPNRPSISYSGLGERTEAVLQFDARKREKAGEREVGGGAVSMLHRKTKTQNLGQLNLGTKGKKIFLEVILTPIPK